MKILTEERAKELKQQGITAIASVVKSVFTTTYYNVNSIDSIMKNNGRWIPAGICATPGWHGRIGISGKQIDWMHTARTDSI